MTHGKRYSLVTPWYGHFAGGAEVAARSFAEQLAARGCDVEVLTTCCRSPYESWWKDSLPRGEEQLGGVTVRRFPVNAHGEEAFHKLNRRLAYSDLNADEQRDYVLHCINSDALVEYARERTENRTVIALPYTQGLVYSVLQALSGRGCLLGCLHDEPQLRWVTTSEMLALSRRILFLTEEEKSLAIRNYGPSLGRTVVESPVVGVGVELPDGVHEMLANREPVDAILARHQLERPYFVYIGRKEVAKNVVQLVEHFRAYRSHGGRAELIFLGGGDASLVPAADGIRDLGFVPELDKYALLSRALGLINLSDNESFSLVMMEAWLCAVPVIASSNCAVTSAHCLRSRGGVAIASEEEFVTALGHLDTDEVRQAMGACGQRYTRARYSWNHVVDNLLRGAA